MSNEKPKNEKALIDLDDPDVDPDEPPDTQRPELDSAHFAKHVETADHRKTVAPAPTYDMLRDSCRMVAVAVAVPDVILDDEAGSSGVHPTDETPAAKAARLVLEADEAKRKAAAKK